jgi:hypothetical protein
MTAFHKKATLLICAGFLWASSIAHAAPPPSAAALTDALDRLQQYREELARMRDLAHTPLGPYRIATDCTWCSDRAWWGLGIFCTEGTTQRVAFTVDFNRAGSQLRAVVHEAEQSAGDFSRMYAPTEAWLAALPELSRRFNENADVILAIDEEIRRGNGPTDQQRADAVRALENLTKDLDRSAAQLRQGTQALAAFLERQSEFRKTIRQAIAASDQAAREELDSIASQLQKQAHPDCMNVVNDRFNSIRRDFDRSTHAITAGFQHLERRSVEAEKSVAVLLAAVVDNQTNVKSVTELVRAAGKGQTGSVLVRLHLSSAKRQWAALAGNH